MVVDDEVRRQIGDLVIQTIVLRCELAKLQEENTALKTKLAEPPKE